MSGLMKAVAVFGPGDVRIVNDVPIPEVGDYEALVQAAYCGFCNGTDTQLINGTVPKTEGLRDYPFVLGHEGAGVVIKIGKKVRNIRIGDRYIHNNLHEDAGNGYHKAHGGMAEYGLVVDHQAMLEDGYTVSQLEFYKKFARVPRDFKLKDAAMLLTLSECMSAVRNFGIGEGMHVLIFGGGPMGIACAAYSKLAGAEYVMLVDGNDSRLEHAKKVAHVDATANYRKENVEEAIGDHRFHAAIDAVGATRIIAQASGFLKPYGVVGSLGVLKANDRMLDFNQIQNNTRVQKLNYPYGEYDIMDENIELIRKGLICPEDYYSHVLPMDEVGTAMQMIKERKALKVILEINGNLES